MTDQTTTWMGHTLTQEFIARMVHKGLNPWLSAISGQEVPLAGDDWRRTDARKTD